jgi:UDP-2,3-diacylglucosamine pyrophosphatase LpxH
MPFGNRATESDPRPPRAEVYEMRCRSVFISDTHLGCSYAKATRLFQFLSTVRPEFIYLVGDFIDGWELKRRWNWPPEFTRVVKLLVELSHQGSVVRYAIGNHDDFLRQNSLVAELINAGGIEIAEDFVHLTGDNRRFLVIHGDRFDRYSHCTALFDRLSTVSYNMLLGANDVWHRWFGGRHGVLSGHIKASLGSLTRHLREFRSLTSKYAESRGCVGVICGHVHAPELSKVDGVEYCNTGDWLENCSAIIEDDDGCLSLYFPDERSTLAETCSENCLAALSPS